MTSNPSSLRDKLSPGDRQRLSGLIKTAQAELLHLQQTDQRLFGSPFSPEDLLIHLEDIDFSERVDAFVARFGRLQDLLGDKLLPAWLRSMEEGVGADDWLAFKPGAPPSSSLWLPAPSMI